MSAYFPNLLKLSTTRKKKKNYGKVAHFCTFLHFKKKYRCSTPKLRERVSHHRDPHNTNHLSLIPITHYITNNSYPQFLIAIDQLFQLLLSKTGIPFITFLDNYYIPNCVPYLKKKKRKIIRIVEK